MEGISVMIYKFYTKLNISPNIIEEPELNIVGTQALDGKQMKVNTQELSCAEP